MTEIVGLVSVLSAHLDKVEQDERGKRKLRVGYGDEDYCPTCGTWVDHVFGGKFNACGCPVPGEWWEPNPDEERLGLVRATRDLIDQRACAHRELASARTAYDSDSKLGYDTSGLANSLRRHQVEIETLDESLRAVARGWGVTDDKEDRDG